MNYLTTIDGAFALRTTITLLHFVWQGTLIAAFAHLIAALSRCGDARVRYAVYVTALVSMLASVVVTFSLVELHLPLRKSTVATGPAHLEIGIAPNEAREANHAADAGADAPNSSNFPPLHASSPTVNEQFSPSPAADSAWVPPAAYPKTMTPRANWIAASARYVTAGYLVGVMLCLLRLARGLSSGLRLRQHASPSNVPDLMELMREQARAIGLRSLPAVRWCAEATVPVVMGVVRPLVLVPAAAATGLTCRQLQALLAHELAHLRRHDLAVNLLQRLIESLLFFHPAVWFISRRINEQRELACDDLVLAAGWDPSTYADALVRMAELSHDRRLRTKLAALSALAATTGTPTEFKRRVYRILGIEPAGDLRPGRTAILVTMLSAILALAAPLVWHHVAPLAHARQPAESDANTAEPNAAEPQAQATRDVEPEPDKQPDARAADNSAPADAAKPSPAADTAAKDTAAKDTPGYRVMGNSMSMIFSPDGRRLAVMNGNPTRTWYRDGRTIANGWKPIVDVIDSETDQVVTSLDLSDLPDDDDRPADQGPTFVEATAIAFSPDGNLLAVGTSVGHLKLYIAATGKLVKSLDDETGRAAIENIPDVWQSQPRVMGRVKAVAFSPDGNRIAVCGESFADWSRSLDRIDRGGVSQTAPGRLKVFDLDSGKLLFKPPAHDDQVMDVAYSPDGKYLASAGRWMDSLETGQHGNGLILFDAKTGERRARLDLQLRGWMYDVEFSADSQSLLIGAQDFDSGGGNGTGVVAMIASETAAVLWKRTVTRSAMKVAFYSQESAVIVLQNRESLAFLAAESGRTEMVLRPPVTELQKKEKQPRCESFAISPAGHLLAFGVVEKGRGHIHYLRMGKLKPDADVENDSPNLPAGEASNPQPDSPTVDSGATNSVAPHSVVERLPNWLRPYYGNGLSATLDDDGEVVTVTASGDVVTDEILEKLVDLPELRELHLEVSKHLTEAGLRHLGRMSTLQKLSLYNINTEGAALGDQAIRGMIGLDSLRELSIGECGTTDAGAKLLEQLPQLKSLSLRQEGKLTDEALQSIGKLTRLESLALDSYVATERFGRMQFSAEGVRHLGGLTNLRALRLFGHEVPADMMHFPNLTTVALGHPMVGDDVAKKLSEHRSLTAVELTYCGITDQGLGDLASLPNLQQLDLSSQRLTDAALEPFRGHPQLTHLSLRAGGVTDRTLQQIAKIETLRRLDLNGSGQPGFSSGRNFTSTGLASLARLPQLRTLWLTNFDLDGGYGSLAQFKQLRELTMMMCNITVAELESLEAAQPNTRITHTTGGASWMSKSNSPPALPFRSNEAPAEPLRAAEPAPAGSAPAAPASTATDVETQLLAMLVRGGKLETKTVNAAVTLVAARGARDAKFARVVLREFEQSAAGGERTQQAKRHLLAVVTEMFEVWGGLRWREQLAPLNPNDLPQTESPRPDATGELESNALAMVVKFGYQADRSDIGKFALAVRALHHPASKPFLTDILQNPQTTSKTENAKWKDNLGGQWTDAKYVAGVGLAELGEHSAVEWLLARARPNEFGLDSSLFHARHFHDPRGSLRESSRMALIDLFGQQHDATHTQLQQWWITNQQNLIFRSVVLKAN